MKYYYIFALFCATALPFTSLSAQKEDKAIKSVINRFFDAMEKADTAALLSTCMPEPVLQTYMKDKDGNLQLYTENFADFVSFIANPGKDKFREEVEFEAIHSEVSLASVWTPYKFYLNGKISHCGTNSFQMVKTSAGWKIQYILDTRRKGCK